MFYSSHNIYHEGGLCHMHFDGFKIYHISVIPQLHQLIGQADAVIVGADNLIMDKYYS